MAPDVPLMGYHKRAFVLRRLAQTFLGGPRLMLGQSAPSYVFVHQILLFLVPWALGGVCSLLYQLGVLEDFETALLSGALMLAAATVIQGTSLVERRRRASAQRVPKHNPLMDEEVWEFSSCLGSETVAFLIPGKKHIIFNVIGHSIISAVLCSSATCYLLPSRLTSLFHGNIGVCVAIFVLGWLTVCVVEYALIVNTPPETAAFQATDDNEIMPLLRPSYVFLFVAVDLADRFTADVPDLRLANQILHVAFLVLPLVWTLGVLPPLDALFLWGMEQLLEIGLGGSPMSSDIRLLGMVLLSVGTAFTAYFIPSSLGLVVFMTGCRFALSLDLTQIGFAIKDLVTSSFTIKQFKDLTAWCCRQFRWREILFHLSVFLLALVEASLLHSAQGDQAFSTTSLQAVMSYILVGLLLGTWVLQEIQAIYIFGIVRNPFYPTDITIVNRFAEKNKGFSRIGAFRKMLTTIVSPLAMIAFLLLDDSLNHLPSVSVSIGLTRSFRMVWQNTECALADMVLVSTIQLLVSETDLWWNRSLDTGTRLLLIGFIRNRLFQFLSKLRFAVTVLVTSWTERRQRRKSSLPLIALNVAFFPILLILIALSALLSSPLLPLFSLPIFLIGFPRPVRSWPGPVGKNAFVCPDTAYYQQMVPSLTAALQTAFASGSLDLCLPGSQYLCRFQDRLAWIHVLERGYAYCRVNIKGLELEETSCQASEARRVDDIFEEAFECRHPRRPSINRHVGNILSACTVLPIKAYSDARNSLAGIMDLQEKRAQLKADFVRVLLWVLVQESYKKIKMPKTSGEAPSRESLPFTHPEVSIAMSVRSSRSGSLHLESMEEETNKSYLPDLESGRRTQQGQGSVPRLCSSLPDTAYIEDETTEERAFSRLYQSVLCALPTFGIGKQELSCPPSVTFRSKYSELLAMSRRWRTAPVMNAQLKELKERFPQDWFHCVLRQLYFSRLKDCHFTLLGDLLKDPALREVYIQAILPCWLAFFGSDQTLPSPGQITKMFNGDVPWSIPMCWLSERQELFQLALKAFRYTVKLVVDEASLGPVESFKKMLSWLETYENDWFFGAASEQEWQQAVLKEKPFLFSLGYDAEKGLCTSRTLTLQEFLVPVGKLSGEAVRGQWANASWETLYATNEDEERFSMQAHPVLLRNLTVQAADPPPGSPVYSSEPLHVPFL
uniref:pecanex-like protein 4 n=1 Tax=Euleptes europaea TaxID=460621 RepID=UPI00253FA751|nr:pecanex-like protein 4 [Euleptes europaea]